MRIIIAMFIVMLTACSRHNDEFSAATDEPGEPSVLRIYVYQPDRPIVTRAGEGEVNPINNTLDESTINNIHIWVFNTNDKALIAYHSSEGAASDLSIVNDDGVVYQLAVSPAFEAAAVKPNVDVYVLANDTRFDGSTTAAQLEAAMIEGSNYGPATLTTQVPAGGLPMSGVMRNMSVTGTAPVYSLPTIRLLREMSKIRFIFCREEGQTAVKINSILLKENMIPTEEYVFLGNDAQPYHISETFVDTQTEFVSSTDPVKTDICQNGNPLNYTYADGTDPQAYEDKLNDALSATTPKLSQVGPFYLRESNKQLSGTITYQAGDNPAKTIAFSMSATSTYGFSRNHTWTVYAYYGGSSLELITVFVKNWVDTNYNHEVYNW